MKVFDGIINPLEANEEEKTQKKTSSDFEDSYSPEEEIIIEAPRLGAPTQPVSSFKSIDIKEIDVNLFMGEKENLWRPVGMAGVFGGQIVGQSLAAALKTVSGDRRVHSLHSYFVSKGDPNRNIIYSVQVIRDGKTFGTRLVTASQSGSTIFIMLASFQIPVDVHVHKILQHQVSVPVPIPPPSTVPTMEEYYLGLLNDPRCPQDWKPIIEARARSSKGPLEIRPVYVSDFFYRFGDKKQEEEAENKFPKISPMPMQAAWIRTRNKQPADQALHAAILAYASDSALLVTAKYNVSTVDIQAMASLDHSMWFHRSFQVDDWLLYYLESPKATDGRGLAYGGIFTQDGTLVVTVAQEGLIRLKNTIPRL